MVAVRLVRGVEVVELAHAVFAKGGEFGKMQSDEGGNFRWITVHPWGRDHDGVPVKLRESKTSPGTWHVVGGAGGKLNYMRLTGLASPEEMAQRSREKKAAKKAAKAAEKAKERERRSTLSPEERASEDERTAAEKARRQQAATELETAKRELVKTVAEKLGWKDEEWQFDARRQKLEEAKASPEVIATQERAHWRTVYDRARAAIEKSKHVLLADGEVARAWIGQAPLTTTDPDTIGLTDVLDKPKTPKGKGFKAVTGDLYDAKVRASIAGGKAEELRQGLTELEQQLAAQRSEGQVDEHLATRVEEMRGELHIAELTVQAATMKPEQIEAERREVVTGLDAAKADRARLVPELSALAAKEGLSAEETARAEALRADLAVAEAQLAALKSRSTDLDVLSGEVAKWAAKPEAKAIARERMLKRKAEIEAAEGAEAATRFQERVERMREASERTRAEQEYLRAIGAIAPVEVRAKALDDPADVLQLLAMAKKLEASERALGAAEREEKALDERLFGKPAFLKVEALSEADMRNAAAEIENAIETRLTQAFLDRADSADLLLGRGGEFSEDYDRTDLHRALDRHMSAGAFNAINTACLAATKTPMISREVVDVLGAQGAAQLLATVIVEQEGRATAKRMAGELGDWHVQNNVLHADERVREMTEELEAADEAISHLSSPSELAVAVEANKRRQAHIEEARQIIGQALGEYEATAQLVQALGEGAADEIHASLGPIDTETAVKQVRALGLDRDDYSISSDGTNQMVTIKRAAFPKLARPVDVERARVTDEVLSIKRGDQDDPNWRPKGAAQRSSESLRAPGIEPAPFRASIKPAREWSTQADLEEHVAMRVADGEDIDSVVRDVASDLSTHPRGGELLQKLNGMFPTQAPVLDADGKPKMLPVYRPVKEGETVDEGKVIEENGVRVIDTGEKKPAMRSIRASDHAAKVDEWVRRTLVAHGFDADTAPINGQGIDLDNTDTQEALYRGLAEDPRAAVAFHDLGALTHQHQRALRSYFASEIARGDDRSGLARVELERQLAELGPEPPKEEVGGLFKTTVTSPAWLNWKAAKDQLMERAHFAGASAKTSDWTEFVALMGGTGRAYAALQDHMKSKLLHRFHQAYTNLTGQPLRLGIRPVAHDTVLGGYLDPTVREHMRTQRAELQADLMNRRTTGQFAEGSIAERIEQHREHEEAHRQAQAGFLFGQETKKRREPTRTERYHLGQRVERQLAQIMPTVASRFRIDGGKVDLLADKKYLGPKGPTDASYANTLQQRAIKAFLASKRMAATLGTGTGKSSIAINALTHGHGEGKIKRALFIVPSSNVGQWAPEFGRFADPSAISWAANLGTSHEERMAEHAGSTTAIVHSHESFRDDMLKLLAKHWSCDEATARERFMGLDRSGARDAMREAWKGAGISYDMFMVDEGHTLLDRAGKPDSMLSRVSRAVSDLAPYYMSASADPIKNDVSELRSLMDKMDPSGRYADAGDWQRRYGVNTTSSAEALKREVAPFIYAGDVPSKNAVRKSTETVPLSAHQRQGYADAIRAFEKLRAARLAGRVDTESARALVPELFEGKPEAEHEAIARRVQQAASSHRDEALKRLIDDAPLEHNAKLQKLVEIAKGRDLKSKPMVVFAHRLTAVKRIADALRQAGIVVDVIDGSVPQKVRDQKRRAFQDGKTHVFVLSDAAETGLNLTKGQCLVQYDRPLTAKTHEQRNGRIDRKLVQVYPEGLDMIDLVTDSPFEARAEDRLARKYDLREILTDPADMIDDSGMAGAFLRARRDQALGKAAA